MPRKFDGVIEAVRYKNGQILFVRAYERRGATFSDRVLLDRRTLVERLQQGRQFVVGAREEFRASTFQVGAQVRLVDQAGQEWISTRPDAGRDVLEGAPVF